MRSRKWLILSTSTLHPKMKNERRTSKLQFTPERLRELGYVKQPDGSWAKQASADLAGLATDQQRQQARALERKTQTTRRRKAGSPQGNIRDRAACVTVTMTAHIPTRMDGDNLANALKPVRDEIADWLGADDADGRIRWECGQVETRGAVGVCVSICHPTPVKESFNTPHPERV
jgi:hypothetical protein